MSLALYIFMEGFREGGVYKTAEGMVVVVCADPRGAYVLYVLEDAETTERAEGRKAVKNRRKFELFKSDAEGRLSRFGRRTDWRIEDLELTDTGETVRPC